jgi:hypothetical protein
MAESNLAHDRLKALLSYDAETGRFVRRVRRTNALKSAGSARSDGYVSIYVDGRAYKAHRLAWFYAYGAWPAQQLDHINGQRSDNRLANLREATHSLNLQNRIKPYANNRSSGLLGVYWHRSQRWQARIQVNGKARSLGFHATKEAAHRAYLAAKAKLHPFAPR